MSLAILLRIQEKQILFTYLPYEHMQRQFIWGKIKILNEFFMEEEVT